jgi:hypothetical protein
MIAARVFDRASRSNEGHAAVQDDGLPGHVTIPKHHRDRLRDFIGLTHAPNRNVEPPGGQRR